MLLTSLVLCVVGSGLKAESVGACLRTGKLTANGWTATQCVAHKWGFLLDVGVLLAEGCQGESRKLLQWNYVARAEQIGDAV